MYNERGKQTGKQSQTEHKQQGTLVKRAFNSLLGTLDKGAESREESLDSDSRGTDKALASESVKS